MTTGLTLPQRRAAGSGIILAGPAPAGGVYDNLVTGNHFSGDGQAGVVIYACYAALISAETSSPRNWIGRSKLRDDTDDTQTTGVSIGDASPLTIAVLGNTVSGNYYGIFTAGTIKGQVPFLSAS